MAIRDVASEQGLFLTTTLFIILSGVTILLTFGGGPLGSSGLALSSRTSNQIYTAAAMLQAPLVPSANIVLAKDQKLSSGVTASEVRMANSGFLLVRRASKGGLPDEIVGASGYLGAGVYHNLQVSFYTGANKPKISAGDTLFLTMAKDDGNKNFDELDFKNAALDVSGKELAVKFKIL